ncbi:MAG: hypothetical protein P1U85_21765 [Verrucomicrobiales bacterium]|jgi:hypothetical protein|nr:hypothetical protein [Verrucomicrobiales bacterium]
MFSKMFISKYLCKEVELTARAIAAHYEGAFDERGEWFRYVMKNLHKDGMVKEVFPHGRMFSDAVFLCHLDEVSGENYQEMEVEFEEYDLEVTK